jgi:hypothetical protein
MAILVRHWEANRWRQNPAVRVEAEAAEMIVTPRLTRCTFFFAT